MNEITIKWGAATAPSEFPIGVGEEEMRIAQERGKPPYKAVLAKVNVEAHKQIKKLAADRETTVGDLLVEAINLLFQCHDLPENCVRISPPEDKQRAEA